jgi:uncharacterized protein YjbI with pentapeptide repeats
VTVHDGAAGNALVCNEATWQACAPMLAGCDLALADLHGKVFSGDDLSSADLESANLNGADLSGAILTGASLAGATLDDAKTAGAFGCPALLPTSFHCYAESVAGRDTLIGPHAVLAGASLIGADLATAVFSDVDLKGANLSNAQLAAANLSGVHSAGLVGSCPSTLPSGFFCVPNAGKINLLGPSAELDAADLSGADLTNANLSGVILNAVDLTGADLSGANFSGVSLDHVITQGLASCPAQLAAGYTCAQPTGSSTFVLAGPGVDLTGAALAGLDLSATSFDGARAVGLTSCPAQLPAKAACVADASTNLFMLLAHGIDAHAVDLTGRDLSQLDLHDVVLANAKLDSADLSGTNLTNVELTGASLLAANLAGTVTGHLPSCPGTITNTWKCAYNPAENLYLLAAPGVDLSNITIEVDLSGLDLSNGLFANTTFHLEPMNGVNLTSAKLTGASFLGLDASNATLALADLSFATVPGSKFVNADLHSANVTHIFVDTSDFTGANLTGVTGSSAYWSDTICPSGVNSSTQGNMCP